MSDEPRSYSPEEVDAILRRALSQKEHRLEDGLSHAQLIETAREVGIEPASLERAIVEHRQEQERLEMVQAWKARHRAAFLRMVALWAVVGGLCFVIDTLTAGGPWFQWVVVPWGALLLLRALRLGRDPTPREFARFERRRRRKLRRREARERWQRNARRIEEVIDAGARHLMRQLDDGTRRLEEEQRRRRLRDGRPPWRGEER